MDADIIISSGAVSAGDADYVPAVLNQLGVQKLFHKVAIKPGKPFWCGKNPGGGMVFALPGNPLSCLVTFTIFIRPFLNACFGLQAEKPFDFMLDGERTKKSELDEFFPVRFKESRKQLQPVPFNGSGDIQAALFADGIALHPFDRSEIKQEPVRFFYL
jgi:molybdopterin molybdotransferase